MNKQRVVVVGGGPGGLAAAMLLSHRGFEVSLYERRPTLGGRSGGLKLGPYTFDVGSTMLMMPFVVHELFALCGKRLEQEVDLVRLEPMYRLDYGSRAIDMFSDPERMSRAIERFSAGQEPGLTRFLSREAARLAHLYPMLQRDWPGLSSLVSRDVLKALPHVGLTESLYQAAAECFSDEALRLAFSFQAAYLGMCPWDCPAGFGMVPYVEHAWGVHYVRGGIQRLNLAMANVAREAGAVIHSGSKVRRLLLEHDRAVGVELDDGSVSRADHVVINADATAALLGMLESDVSLRFNRAHLRHLDESCSTFMLYLGLNEELPLAHHTFFFADDYRSEMRRVFHEGSLGDDFSMYVCNPTRTDPNMAPAGHSAVCILVLVPNTRAAIDWTKAAPALRGAIMDKLEEKLGTSVRKHVQQQATIGPSEWRDQFEVSHGAVFGPSHSIGQLLAFRLPNRLPHPANVFLAGGGTNPGSGLPTILESARIATRMICEDAGIDFPASLALPHPPPHLPKASESARGETP